jgi:hypothetical protein
VGQPVAFHRVIGTPTPSGAFAPLEHEPGPVRLPPAPYHPVGHRGRPAIVGHGALSGSAIAATNYPAAWETGVQMYNTQTPPFDPSDVSSTNPLVHGGVETSEADGGGVVVYTGNWFAAWGNAANGTASWHTMNIQSPVGGVPGNAPAGMTFCCDQVVEYVPQADLFVWVLQYLNNSDTGSQFFPNAIRIAVASPQQIDAAGDNQTEWAYTDITPSMVNRGGDWFDYPDVEFDQNNLFVSINEYHQDQSRDASTIIRMNLRDLEDLAFAHGPGPGNEPWRWYTDEDAHIFRVAQNPDAPSSAYVATQLDADHLRVYSWSDDSNFPESSDIEVPTIPTRGISSGAAGQPFNWLGPGNGTSIPDTRPVAGTTSDLLWPHLLFAWQGGTLAADQNGNFHQAWPQPHIEIADINLDPTAGSGYLTLNRMNYIWSTGEAFGRPELATNQYAMWASRSGTAGRTAAAARSSTRSARSGTGSRAMPARPSR